LDEGRRSNQLDSLAKANQALQSEIAGRQEAEEELRLLLAVTRAMAESEDFQLSIKDGPTAHLRADRLGLGEIWVPNAKEDVLQFG
jgi:hypothetical protein